MGERFRRSEKIRLDGDRRATATAVGHVREARLSVDEHLRTLWVEWHRFQENAKLADGSPMPKQGKEGWYGFHDLRRGFATLNAENLDLFKLQSLMQHKSLETTRLYVNLARQLNRKASEVFVPEVLSSAVKAV